LDSIEAVIRRLPGSAEQVRRLFWRDPVFRTVCADYRAAFDALARLEAAPGSDPRRVEEYRQIVAELLCEAATMLKGDRR
jgi:hypothetical protein